MVGRPGPSGRKLLAVQKLFQKCPEHPWEIKWMDPRTMEMWLTLTFAGARSTELRAAESTTLVFKEGSPTLGKLRSGAFGGQLNCCVSGLTQPVKSVKLLQANIESHPKTM